MRIMNNGQQVFLIFFSSKGSTPSVFPRSARKKTGLPSPSRKVADSGSNFVPDEIAPKPFLPLRAGIDIVNKGGVIRKILLDASRATEDAGQPVAMVLEKFAEHGVFEEHCNQFLHVELVVDRICPFSPGTAVGWSTVDRPPCTRWKTLSPACPTIQVGLTLPYIEAAVVNTSIILLSGGDLMGADGGM